MNDTSSAFALWHRHDRNFFLSYVIVAWFLIVTGFALEVFQRFTGGSTHEAQWSLIIHVWSFAGWMCLLTLQVLLIRIRRIDLHRLTGMAMLALLPVILVSAFMAEVYSVRLQLTGTSVSGMIFQMSELLVFAIFAVLAFLMRGNAPAHKRLIILATSTILAGATTRVMTIVPVVALGLEQGLAFRLEYEGSFAWGGPIVLVATAALYDRLTRGRVHPVLSVGLMAVIATYLLTSAMNQSEWWLPMAQRLLGL